MWIFTVDGFFSAVEHRDDPDTMIVRARVYDDLARLNQRLELPRHSGIVSHAGSDYAFRIYTSRETWARYLAAAAAAVDYDNFKNAVADRAGRDRAAVYGRVWATLYTLQVAPGTPPVYDDPEERETIAPGDYGYYAPRAAAESPLYVDHENGFEMFDPGDDFDPDAPNECANCGGTARPFDVVDGVVVCRWCADPAAPYEDEV